MTAVRIGDRPVGDGAPTYVIAELSGNHAQNFERAVALVRAAKAAGADAVKTQTYTAETLTIRCDRPWFRIGEDSLWSGRTLYDLYEEAFTPWDWQPRLQQVAKDVGIDFFSSPFDDTAVDLLERMNVPAYKIASFECIHLDLLRRVARTGRPVLLSTGMASRDEIDEGVRTLRDAGADQIVVLKCTSAYPARPEEMNLRTIPDLARTLGVVVGLSDHSLGHVAATTAVALGASVIEKHFTLTRADGGPDAAFSLEPSEFADLVRAVRETEGALGRVSYERSAGEVASLVFRRSLFVVRDVHAGEPFTEGNVRCIRPGHGLHPRHLHQVLGRYASRDIERGTPLDWEMVAEDSQRRG